MAAPTPGHPRLALASALTAPVALVGGWAYAASLQPDGYDWVRDPVSWLATAFTPHRWAMTSALVVAGLAHVVTGLALPGLQRAGRLALSGAGMATVLVAAFPEPERGAHTLPHLIATVAMLALLALWPTGDTRTPGASRWARAVLPGALFLVAASALLPVPEGSLGLRERLATGLLASVPLGFATRRWWAAGHRVGTTRARTWLTAALVTVLCALGGATTTALAPTSTETRYYQARVSLALDPRESAHLVAPTVFGDVDAAFAGIAPGLQVTPQVKASIAELLARPHLSMTSLQPGELELASAAKQAGIGVGLRFALGALAVALLVAAARLTLASRNGGARRPRARRWLRALALPVAAALVATTATAAAIWRTYQPDRLLAFTSTGILGSVQRNSGLLEDVEARSGQAVPYLRNLIALSTALQTKYSPTTLDSPAALRIALVSDIHGGNQYPLLKSIIAEEKVDAVVDAGDLLTFGTVAEGEAAGIFTGIASLGVPYFFVRGNHDATSATDDAVLKRLERIPNVVVLQPGPATFTEAELHGIRITGLNDPRWFGDDGKRSAAKQRPVVDAYERAYAGSPAPDLVVGHEPASVMPLEGGVLVNGHLHTADLEGNRIQAGTFTGGGPFTHYLSPEPGAELTGQPSAFDVLVFGEQCRLTSLTRYRFRDILEGRPAYDAVTLINGAQVDTRPPEAGRTCSPDEPLRTTSWTDPSPASEPVAP
jgi:predicted phosphodiesterase/hypothetical membrane protein